MVVRADLRVVSKGYSEQIDKSKIEADSRTSSFKKHFDAAKFRNVTTSDAPTSVVARNQVRAAFKKDEEIILARGRKAYEYGLPVEVKRSIDEAVEVAREGGLKGKALADMAPMIAGALRANGVV